MVSACDDHTVSVIWLPVVKRDRNERAKATENKRAHVAVDENEC